MNKINKVAYAQSVEKLFLWVGKKPGLWTRLWTGLWTGLGLNYGLDSVLVLPFKKSMNAGLPNEQMSLLLHAVTSSCTEKRKVIFQVMNNNQQMYTITLNQPASLAKSCKNVRCYCYANLL